MQYIVDSEQFDFEWDFMMEYLLQAVVSLLLYVTEHRVLRKFHTSKDDLSGGLVSQNPPKYPLPIYKRKNRPMGWTLFAEILGYPAAQANARLLLVTLIISLLCDMGIPEEDSHCACTAHAIYLRLAAATNLVLTALTASHVGFDRTLRSRYNMAIGIILESGAIYCITAIFLVIIASQYEPEIYNIGIGIGLGIGLGIGEQLISTQKNTSTKFHLTMLPPARS
ncbi:hypothetical protein B0H13DRAFT_1856641 [Mycena leptocephala]|nr:hypothetical protein B0H13DRAFT_1856641 [Mycena leptocephala]